MKAMQKHIIQLISFWIVCLFMLTLLFQSCDPVFWTRINNKSGNDIILEIQFDKDNIESVWSGRPYIAYLKGILNGGGTTIQFDTVNLISRTRIGNNESFQIDGGIGTKPDFFNFEKLIIYSKDTLRLDTKDKMEEAFKDIGNANYELEIK